jgi:pimeloyl-ACP methyl ester carboxylesterase
LAACNASGLARSDLYLKGKKMLTEYNRARFECSIAGTALDVSAIQREGDKAPILFLHGFGSTKEDYADIVRHPEFAGHPFVAYDAPGCGETHCADLSKISIPFLMDTALAVLDRIGFDRFHLVGHSMGGLTALMLAHRHPERVISFVDIEGNIAPEDCFLSRQIDDHPHEDAARFFHDFIERIRLAPAYASGLYSASLWHKVRAEAVGGIFRSMVDLSDNGDLMMKFLSLPFPRMFMYGEQNASLSYLSHIRKQGVELTEIPHCGHFPMYSNPVLMWKAIAAFHRRAA